MRITTDSVLEHRERPGPHGYPVFSALGLMALSALLTACGADTQPGDGAGVETPAPAVHTAQGLDVQVALGPPLASSLRVVSTEARVPGVNNPKEAVIVVENTGSAAVSARLQGQWRDAGGRGLGGVRTTLEIAAGARQEIASGTRSANATRFLAELLPPLVETDDPVDAAILEAAARGARGYGTAFTPNPALAEIPAWPARGLANGALFHARTVLFRPNEGGWRLEIHDREFDPLMGTAMADNQPGTQTIYVDLPAKPESGAVYRRPMSFGDAYFRIKASPDAPDTTSWNAPVAWTIAIDDWELRPWSEGGDPFQRGGRASGRLYICFQASQGPIQNSFVAGEFKDAPIMYYGRPR